MSGMVSIIAYCAGGFLLGVLMAWLVSGIVSRIRRNRLKAAPEKNIFARIGTMNLILIIVGISLAWFTHRMITLYEMTGGIPDTLCQCVFAVLGGECGVMGWIKTNKDKRQDRKWSEEDRVRMEREAKEQAAAQNFEPEFNRQNDK